MVEQRHWLNGHAFEQTPGDGEGQGSMVCCSWWGGKESDMTEQLNNKIYIHIGIYNTHTHIYRHTCIYMCVYNLKSEYPNLILGWNKNELEYLIKYRKEDIKNKHIS